MRGRIEQPIVWHTVTGHSSLHHPVRNRGRESRRPCQNRNILLHQLPGFLNGWVNLQIVYYISILHVIMTINYNKLLDQESKIQLYFNMKYTTHLTLWPLEPCAALIQRGVGDASYQFSPMPSVQSLSRSLWSPHYSSSAGDQGESCRSQPLGGPKDSQLDWGQVNKMANLSPQSSCSAIYACCGNIKALDSALTKNFVVNCSKEILLGNAWVVDDELKNVCLICISKLLVGSRSRFCDTILPFWPFSDCITDCWEGNVRVALLNALITPSNIIQFAYANALCRSKLLSWSSHFNRNYGLWVGRVSWGL